MRFGSCHHHVVPRTCTFPITLLPRCRWTQTDGRRHGCPATPAPSLPSTCCCPSPVTTVALVTPDTASRKSPLDLCPQTPHLIRITLTLVPMSTKALMTYLGFRLLSNLAPTSTCVGRVCVLPDSCVSSCYHNGCHGDSIS